MAESDPVPKTMKALRLTKFKENYKLQTDVPVPIPGPGEVLVRVKAAGFCHTDYQVYQGAYNSQLPITGSHEPVGVIAALGSDVPGKWSIGDKVGVLLMRNPCGDCGGCRWCYQAGKSLDARYCEEKVMCGILGSDGGFAEYMIAAEYCLVRLPACLTFEQAAPLMCAGATVWKAIAETGLKAGETIAIVGIGGLGVLGVQFAKTLGLRVVAVDNRDVGLKLASEVPEGLRPDLIVGFDSEDAIDRISAFTDGIGLHGAVVCTDTVLANDWALHRLRPRGVCVVLGLPEEGFRFDAFNLVFREIVVKGSLTSGIEDVSKMLEAVAEHGITSHLSIIPLNKGENIPEIVAKHAFIGRLVILI